MNKLFESVVNKKLVLAIILAAIAIAGLGLGLGYWWGSNGHDMVDDTAQQDKPLYYRNPMNPEITSPVPAQDEMGMDYIPVYADKPKAEPKILFYRNPMNPEITSPVPAQDEMGMDYIPVYADDGQGDAPVGTVSIDPVTVQNIGVRIAVAERRQLTRTLQTVGRVGYNEERLARLHPKTEGWIEELYINKTGEQVKQDTILLNIYSPQLVTSQQEYLLALKNWATLKHSPIEDIRRGARDLKRTSRERLELLDVPEHQIRELEQSGKIKKNLHIHSPFQGIITRIGAREGEYVTPKTELYTIADLSQVWVYADIYEDELPWIKTGDAGELRLASAPGKVFKGEISYIYPYAESKTRSIKVRMVFDNPDLQLKPDMFAETTIHTSRQIDTITVPSEAIVRSGTRNLVFVVREPGKFAPREVQLGLSSDGHTQIVKGLEANEQVVTSAQFLIDSESKLREAASKMLEASGDTAAETQHSEHQAASETAQPSQSGHEGHDMSHEGHEMPQESNTDAPAKQEHDHDKDSMSDAPAKQEHQHD